MSKLWEWPQEAGKDEEIVSPGASKGNTAWPHVDFSPFTPVLDF